MFWSDQRTHLLNLSKVIFWILVEYELSERAERVFFMGPDLCKVEDVITELLSLVGGHRLLKKVSRSLKIYHPAVLTT